MDIDGLLREADARLDAFRSDTAAARGVSAPLSDVALMTIAFPDWVVAEVVESTLWRPTRPRMVLSREGADLWLMVMPSSGGPDRLLPRRHWTPDRDFHLRADPGNGNLWCLGTAAEVVSMCAVEYRQGRWPVSLFRWALHRWPGVESDTEWMLLGLAPPKSLVPTAGR